MGESNACAPARDGPARDRGTDPAAPWPIRYGTHLRGLFDRLVAASSLVPNAPVLDMRLFDWTQMLRDNWEAIRDEAIRAAQEQKGAVAPVARWRSVFLWGFGYRVAENSDRCPVTSRVVARIPGLSSAFFAILPPGTHVPPRRGATKGLITCHLGLVVPRDGDARMRVRDRVVRWAEGETLVFDDTYDHEAWNDSTATRIVLLIQFRRPLRQPGRWLADAFLDTLRRSAFVQEARANVRGWSAAFSAMER